MNAKCKGRIFIRQLFSMIHCLEDSTNRGRTRTIMSESTLEPFPLLLTSSFLNFVIFPIFSENPVLFPSFPEISQNPELTKYANFLTEFPDFLTNIQDFLTQHFALDFQSFMDYLCLRNL